jgi:hypothetical protein
MNDVEDFHMMVRNNHPVYAGKSPLHSQKKVPVLTGTFFFL